MPLSPALVRWLEQEGHDAVHASQADLSRAPDEEVLSTARKEGRVVVTADLDYPRLLALAGSEGPGLILFRGGNYSERQILELMARVMAAVPAQELSSSIIVVDRVRIRRRRLPIEPKG
jgi:predicted nuclease of predicted toxin-antitoxin system